MPTYARTSVRDGSYNNTHRIFRHPYNSEIEEQRSIQHSNRRNSISFRKQPPRRHSCTMPDRNAFPRCVTMQNPYEGEPHNIARLLLFARSVRLFVDGDRFKVELLSSDITDIVCQGDEILSRYSCARNLKVVPQKRHPLRRQKCERGWGARVGPAEFFGGGLHVMVACTRAPYGLCTAIFPSPR